MSKYAEIIYPNDNKNTYPFKLAKHLYEKFIFDRELKAESTKVLDIGCSKGTALINFSKCSDNLELYGVDLREENLPDNITFKECDLEKESLPFDDNTFDIVYSKSVLEHVFNTSNFISEAKRVLKPGGLFLALTPDWKSQQDFFWDDFTHVKPFTKKGLRDALLIFGFTNSSCEYFYQLPFIWNRPWLSFIPVLISSICPDFLKWKTKEHRNTKDNKLIRFSKEKMLLCYGEKEKEND